MPAWVTWVTWPDKSFPSGCYDSLQIENLFWAWFVLGLDVIWASGQSSDCFREENGEEEGEERRAGAVRNEEHGKMLTQKCYRALCSQVSQCQRDIKHTQVQTHRFYAELVLCRLQKTWSFGAYHKAPKMYEPKESQSTCLSLDFRGLFFLLLQESSLLAILSCCAPVMHTRSPGAVPGCQFVPLLISSERWPGSAAGQGTVNYCPAGNPEQSCCWFREELGNGIPETWPKSLLFSMLVSCQSWRGTSYLFPASVLKQRKSQRWVEMMLSCLDKINWHPWLPGGWYTRWQLPRMLCHLIQKNCQWSQTPLI